MAELLTFVVLIAAATFAFVRLNDDHGELVALRHQLASVTGRLDKLNERVTSTDSVVAGVNQRLAGVQSVTSHTINTEAVAKEILPSVFTVETTVSIGSAFALQDDASGGVLLVTNYHEVATDFSAGVTDVTLHQGTHSWQAQIVDVDVSHDLAAIHLGQDLPVLKVASGKPAVGDPVLVAGAPLGLGGTVTSGVVSALRSDGSIQFSAPISPGNSGGPVVNSSGAVLGVAQAKVVSSGAEGLGFAIPISTVCSTILHC